MDDTPERSKECLRFGVSEYSIFEIMKRSCFGVSVNTPGHISRPVKTANADNTKFETLGDKIISAAKYGSDIGNSVPVTFDDADNKTAVDVLSSPNHDFFDIAETFGKMVDLRTGSVVEQQTADNE